jgi:hypothetical protein
MLEGERKTGRFLLFQFSDPTDPKIPNHILLNAFQRVTSKTQMTLVVTQIAREQASASITDN